MLLLHNIPGKLKNEFAHSRKGRERGAWFVYSPAAIIIPLLRPKPQICCGASGVFSDLPALQRNAIILSRLRLRSSGTGSGDVSGK